MQTESLEGKIVAVTGASGFIGSNLVEALELEGAVVKVISHTLPKESLALELEGVEFIAHLAAATPFHKNQEFDQQKCEEDKEFTKNLAEAAVKTGALKKFLFLSGTVVYDLTKSIELDEETALEPNSLYGKTKLEDEQILEEIVSQNSEKLVVLRATSVYGPGQKAAGLIPNTISLALENKPIEINGNGSMEKDYLWIGDCVEAIKSALLVGKRVYCIASGKTVSIKEIVEKIVELSKSSSKISFSESKEPEPKITVDISKARSELEWEPKTSIADGLGKQIVWVRKS
ncbi:MAG: hypothetical protein CL943_00670 [Candidatus Diapherotrites archaeon]|uniref:NAD-dependent epimerase/dehydratase domain-containing protein n=1 Tax=Candidatus Iainarchaeum sp. TaxID=3101447 RepID=A0A2D6M049_9ARCH|nr:hypothetical protein [Candidatus Diapherotrites archaeon]|tara:strand:- start:2998 stop:3864 length:867 start_codon:yes stop_codon:yes gene_type:complete